MAMQRELFSNIVPKESRARGSNRVTLRASSLLGNCPVVTARGSACQAARQYTTCNTGSQKTALSFELSNTRSQLPAGGN